MIVKEIQRSMSYMDRALQLAERHIKYNEGCPETLEHVIKAHKTLEGGKFATESDLKGISERLVHVHCPASLFREAERCCAEEPLCKLSTCEKCWESIYRGEELIW